MSLVDLQAQDQTERRFQVEKKQEAPTPLPPIVALSPAGDRTYALDQDGGLWVIHGDFALPVQRLGR